MKFLIPIGLAIVGAVTAVALARRSSSPTLRAYAGAGSPPSGGDGSTSDEESGSLSSMPDSHVAMETPHARFPAPTTAHAAFSVTNNLAPSYKTVTFSSPVPQTRPKKMMVDWGGPGGWTPRQPQ